MQYQFYIPPKLCGIVEMIWEMEIPTNGRYTILPEGKVQLLFPLYHDINISAKKIMRDENPMRNYSCFLSGLHTKPLKTTFTRFHTFGIQMKPVGVKALFGMPLCEIRDYFVKGDVVLDNMQMVEDHLNSENTFMERAFWIERYLSNRIRETPELYTAIRLDDFISKYVNESDSPKKNIYDQLGYSRTQTYRLFNDWFGTSSHSYLRLLQFIRAVKSMHDTSQKLGQIAYKNGYFDQSHFIHAFREFADMTPGDYQQQMTDMPGQLYTTDV